MDMSFEIARIDHPDCYENSGVVVFVAGNLAEVSRFSHCSCYDTGESLQGDWTGSVAELYKLAKENRDYCMPERVVNPTDVDFSETMDLYELVIAWFKVNRLDVVDSYIATL